MCDAIWQVTSNSSEAEFRWRVMCTFNLIYLRRIWLMQTFISWGCWLLRTRHCTAVSHLYTLCLWRLQNCKLQAKTWLCNAKILSSNTKYKQFGLRTRPRPTSDTLQQYFSYHRRRLLEMTVGRDFTFRPSPSPLSSVPPPLPFLLLSPSLSYPLPSCIFPFPLPLSLPSPRKSSQEVWGAL